MANWRKQKFNKYALGVDEANRLNDKHNINYSVDVIDDEPIVVKKQTPATDVLTLYPTFEEIRKQMLKKTEPNRMLSTMIKSQSLAWEGLIWGIDTCLNHLMEHPMTNGYSVQNSRKNEGCNATGYANCNTAYHDTKKVDAVDFLALVKIMACSWFEIPVSDKAFDAYLEFKGSSTTIYRILD